MELDELKQRMFIKEYLGEREEELKRQESSTSKHPCEGMSLKEILSFVTFLLKRLDEESVRNEEIQKRLDMIMGQLDKAQKTNESNFGTLARMLEVNESLRLQLEESQNENEKLRSQNGVHRKFRFGSKSQKGTTVKKETRGRDDDKDDFDGTGDCRVAPESESASCETPEEPKERDYRKGMTYNTMDAEVKTIHRSDRNLLPAGSVLIRSVVRKVFERVCYIREHDYEYLVYRMPDGKIRAGYFPEDGDYSQLAAVPGTHATSDMLAHLAFDKYYMFTPLYREIYRFGNEAMRLSRQTLTNWLFRGAEYLRRLLPFLKEAALAEGSVVNVDETWCRLHLQKKSGKKYIWCLVNRLAKIVIFFYDEGSRGRNVLKDFLGDREIAALQSDGYNIYNYLDDDLVKVEHICCLTHARAKFQYALDQGGDRRAEMFLKLIGELYRLEDEYKRQHLSFDEIKARRNDAETVDILSRLSILLHEMKTDPVPLGDLMQKAVHYLDHFWKQIMNYRNDGRYSIDNSIAEQCIRPLTRERANSLHYASHKGAEVSAIYHTIFSTCKMVGISALDYLKKFFQEVLKGNTDYAALLPATIGLTK